jgi:hypothetical protein
MTTYKQKFDNLMQVATDAARSRFMEDGRLPMTTWLIEDKHDIRLLIAFAPDIPKDDMLTQMRKIARDKDIVRYAVEFEAWLAVAADKDDTRLPSQRSDRMECVVIAGQDRQNNNSLVSIEIERKDGKHYLGDVMQTSNGFASGNFRLFEEESRE